MRNSLRHSQKSCFTQMPNILSRVLSPTAVGILHFLLSQHPSYVIHKSTLYDVFSRRTIDNVFDELIKKGYVAGFSCYIKKNGHLSKEYIYFSSDEPFTSEELYTIMYDCFVDIFQKSGEFPSSVVPLDNMPLSIDERLLNLCSGNSKASAKTKTKFKPKVTTLCCTKRTSNNNKNLIKLNRESIASAKPKRDDCTSSEEKLIQSQIKDQISYDDIWLELPDDKKILNEIMSVMTNVYSEKKHSYLINQCLINVKIIINKFKNYGRYDIEFILKRIKENYSNIRSSVFNYILTALYNIPVRLSNTNRNNFKCDVNTFGQRNMDKELEEMEALFLQEVNMGLL